MHIFFSGIGGTGIGPLALIAKQAGYLVSGSDKRPSQYTDYLQKQGIKLHIGQTHEQIATVHASTPIDWIVHSSAITLEQKDPEELLFAADHNIRTSKRDECLNTILQDQDLRLIAVAGTHGKTTTTAMLVWLFHELQIPVSFSVGAKMTFADMGHFDQKSTYFVYECDEFDRNFLAFHPYSSIITTVDWDHHDIFTTRESYKQAFQDFIRQSFHTTLHMRDATYLGIEPGDTAEAISPHDPLLSQITLPGVHNRQNAVVAIRAMQRLIHADEADIVHAMNKFPGTDRRFEQIAAGLYSDYAHTPEEVRATMQLANELSDAVMAVYEPLTNQRQQYAKELYGDCFKGAQKVLWLPSYLAREDPAMHIYTPEELIAYLPPHTPAEASKQGPELETAIRNHLSNGGLVICMAGGGGGSLDEWLRTTFSTNTTKKHIL